MAMPKIEAVPPIEIHRRLRSLMADLLPHAPAGVSIEPEWNPEFQSWTLWLTDTGTAASGEHVRFIRRGHELAEKYDIELSLTPVEVKDWG
jgi:hypothetical protein